MVRYPGLDLLRAIAILWVMLFHGWTEGLGNPFPAIGHSGWMGVDLFFVLSGYLIGSQLLKSYASNETPDFQAFYLRRAFRIIPAFWFVALLYGFFPRLRESSGMQPLWQFLTFTENLLVDYQHNQTFSHAWSLCVEEHFYLIFPLIAALVMLRPSWKTAWCAGVVIVVGGILLRRELWLHHVSVPGARRTAYIELLYYPTYARLDGLFAGVTLAAIRWFRPALWERAMSRPYRLLVVGLLGLAGAIGLAHGRASYVASVFGFPALAWSFALIVAACASANGVLGRIHVPGARFIATITFSLYLIHKLTWHAVKLLYPAIAQLAGWQSFLIYALTALTAGTLLFLLVEHPFLQLRDRLVARRNVSAATTVTA